MAKIQSKHAEQTAHSPNDAEQDLGYSPKAEVDANAFNEEDNILKQAMAAIDNREQAQPLHHNTPTNTESTAPRSPVIEDAFTRPLYKEYTKHSDTARSRMELYIAEAVHRGETLQARIAELQAEYLDVLVEIGMYKKSLEYKEQQ